MTSIEIFVPESIEDSELCHPVSSEDFERINLLVNGVPRLGHWAPLHMTMVAQDEGRALSTSDSPWLGSHALIFRPRAIQALEPTLREHGELLPLTCPGAEVSMFNATRVLDILDEANSKVMRFTDGRLMRINAYSFRPELLVGVHLFKIPNLRVSPTFVSEAFVQAWKRVGLRGLHFRPIWSSKQTGS